jgi:hypothetical protein
MADDKTLDILIRLGVIGKEDLAAANELMREEKGIADSMNGSMPENLAGLEKEKDALKAAGESAKTSGAEHHALHMALHKLNEIVPGLGSVMAMLSHGFGEVGESAKGATAANEGFLLSMGPMAILLLTVEAVVTWYKFLHDGAKDAGDAQNETWKTADEGIRKARESLDDYITALAKARGADDDYRAGLQQDEAVLNAQTAAQKNVLKALEANELAQATSDAQKKAIKEKYADLEQNLDKSAADEKIKLAQQTIDRINADEKQKLDAKYDLEGQRDEASREYGAADPRARAWDKQIDDLQKQIVKMEEEKTRLQTQLGNEGQIAAVKNQGDVNTSIAKGDVAQSAKGIADIVAGGGTVANDQRAFMVEFADDLAHRIGALKPNQNFTSAQAAATAIENYFNTQADPYNALFAQIHSAMQAARVGQDAYAVSWEQKFAQLEAQIKNGRTQQGGQG